jgi:opacity protein-like surface antigen
MKTLTIAALVAAQIAAVAAPTRAAEIVSAETPRSQQTGTFVGARLRLPLDGERRQPRATLTAAPTVHTVQPSGESRMRIGQGLEFGVQGSELRFDLAGQPVSRLVQGRDAPNGPRTNISTVGWVAIGVVVVAVGVFALYGLCGSGEICDVEDD